MVLSDHVPALRRAPGLLGTQLSGELIDPHAHCWGVVGGRCAGIALDTVRAPSGAVNRVLMTVTPGYRGGTPPPSAPRANQTAVSDPARHVGSVDEVEGDTDEGVGVDAVVAVHAVEVAGLTERRDAEVAGRDAVDAGEEG